MYVSDEYQREIYIVETNITNELEACEEKTKNTNLLYINRYKGDIYDIT